MSAIRQIIKSALKETLPPSWLLVNGSFHDSDDRHHRIALTFDDGPNPNHTPRVLDSLAAAGWKATFFVVGERAKRHPELIRRIAAEGHDLGNHTWSHGHLERMSAITFRDELQSTRKLLQDLTGDDCRLIRPPRGALTISKAIQAWQEQQTIVLWNVDPRDFAMPDVAAMHRWCDGYQTRPGDLVLLHDDFPFASTFIDRMATQEFKPRAELLSHWLVIEFEIGFP